MTIASPEMLLWAEVKMRRVSMGTRDGLLAAISERYKSSKRVEKSLIIDEFAGATVCEPAPHRNAGQINLDQRFFNRRLAPLLALDDGRLEGLTAQFRNLQVDLAGLGVKLALGVARTGIAAILAALVTLRIRLADGSFSAACSFLLGLRTTAISTSVRSRMRPPRACFLQREQPDEPLLWLRSVPPG
jgi:hypothetical protein